MPVKCLTIVVYEESGWDWHLEKTFNPGCEQIVAAIGSIAHIETAIIRAACCTVI